MGLVFEGCEVRLCDKKGGSMSHDPVVATDAESSDKSCLNQRPMPQNLD